MMDLPETIEKCPQHPRLTHLASDLEKQKSLNTLLTKYVEKLEQVVELRHGDASSGQVLVMGPAFGGNLGAVGQEIQVEWSQRNLYEGGPNDPSGPDLVTFELLKCRNEYLEVQNKQLQDQVESLQKDFGLLLEENMELKRTTAALQSPTKTLGTVNAEPKVAEQVQGASGGSVPSAVDGSDSDQPVDPGSTSLGGGQSIDCGQAQPEETSEKILEKSGATDESMYKDDSNRGPSSPSEGDLNHDEGIDSWDSVDFSQDCPENTFRCHNLISREHLIGMIDDLVDAANRIARSSSTGRALSQEPPICLEHPAPSSPGASPSKEGVEAGETSRNCPDATIEDVFEATEENWDDYVDDGMQMVTETKAEAAILSHDLITMEYVEMTLGSLLTAARNIAAMSELGYDALDKSK